jgi:hypothetical protein
MGRFIAGALAVAAAALTALATVQPVQAADALRPLPDTTDGAFNQECLVAHNAYCARHGASPLALDDAAIINAVQPARAASTLEGLSTPPGPGSRGYGENRYWFATYENEPASCDEAVKLW